MAVKVCISPEECERSKLTFCRLDIPIVWLHTNVCLHYLLSFSATFLRLYSLRLPHRRLFWGIDRGASIPGEGVNLGA